MTVEADSGEHWGARGRRDRGDRAISPLSRLMRPSLLLEQRAGLELAQLLGSLVYYGVGVVRGDGAPVMLLPGFLGSDNYLTVLRGWLRRIGYQPHVSGLRRMVGAPDTLLDQVLRRVDEIAVVNPRPLTIIGHSMGGMMGRLLGQLRPDQVAHVITLGSPLCEDPREASHPLVGALADLLVSNGRRAGAGAREQHLIDLMTSPLPDSLCLTCLYTRADAVVHWRACIDSDPRAVAYEVPGTHVGLAWNAAVYQRLGKLLPGR